MDDDSSMYTNDTRDTGRSVNSFNSVVKPRNRDDVGDKAVLALLGNDFELISYTIGDLLYYRTGRIETLELTLHVQASPR